MALNNSSGFNYRKISTADGVGKRLSLHGLGMALDVNPTFNPCYGAPVVHDTENYSKEAAAGYRAFVPENGNYDLSHPSTIMALVLCTLKGQTRHAGPVDVFI
jgi:hypothetical protein